MTLEEFNELEKDIRYQTLWEKGVVIGERGGIDCRFHLYQVDGFYVELEYNYVLNRITGFTTFDNTEILQPYLLQIDLKELNSF
jgi:hypothetical protein